MLMIPTLKIMCTAENFNLFWQKVKKMRCQLDIDEPQLPKKRKVLRRFEEGNAPSEFPLSVEDEYCRVYFEAILDLSVMSIRNRFDQKLRLQNILQCGTASF